MKLASTLLAISLALSSNLANALDDTHELSLPTAGINLLDATIGAGDFILTASDNLNEIKVEATIIGQKDRTPMLSLERKGDSAVLIARFEESLFSLGESPRINLKLTVPANLALKLVDGSGNIGIRGLTNSIQINDGSGDLILNGGTQVTIEDGSGDMLVEESSGELQISDGSGDLKISEVNGNIGIQDGSGDISISNIAGKVEITDGSGDIEVDTALALIINDDGSGEVRRSNIRDGKTHDKTSKSDQSERAKNESDISDSSIGTNNKSE